MLDQTSIEEKQIYLRENILEKGYDANLFANYLIEKKGEDGADIGSWSMNDLQKVVQEFIEKQSSFLSGGDIVIPPPQNSNEITEEQNKPLPEETKNKSPNDNKNEPQNEAPNQQKEVSNIPHIKVNPQLYGIVSPETLPCKKTESTPLSSVENI